MAQEEPVDHLIIAEATKENPKTIQKFQSRRRNFTMMRLINQFSFLELSIVGCCRRRQKQRLMLGSRFSLFFVEHISDHFCWFLMHATFLVVFNVVSYSLTPLHHLFSSTRLYSYPCLFSVRNFPSASLLLNLLSTDIVDIV